MPVTDFGYNAYDRVARDVIEYCRLVDSEKASDVVHEDDLHLHNMFNYVFFDTDVRLVYRLVRLLSLVCKRMENRFINKSTTRVSRSIFHYLEKKHYVMNNPQVMYDFKFGDLRVMVLRVKKQYTVRSLGVKQPDDSFAHDVQYFDSLENAVQWFRMVVRHYCSVEV